MFSTIPVARLMDGHDDGPPPAGQPLEQLDQLQRCVGVPVNEKG